ncbi:MAG TPA: LuxR C-terminal-related transcriptional regulator [Sphingobium sp.]|nr:LuxR C-terminal-related transcriptional regulator [Sphingobium sp.]
MLRTDQGPIDALALRWLSADLRGRLIIDSAWRIHWWNDTAQRALDASRVMHEQDRQLVLDGAAAEKLSAFLAALRAGATGEILTLKDGQGHVAMLGQYDPATDMFCLEVNSSHAEERPLFADFRAIYGLTESEGQAALALFCGKTVVEIARERKVSVDTVRTQVRKMYGKIGAQSREKFFKMLMPFRIV